MKKTALIYALWEKNLPVLAGYLKGRPRVVLVPAYLATQVVIDTVIAAGGEIRLFGANTAPADSSLTKSLIGRLSEPDIPGVLAAYGVPAESSAELLRQEIESNLPQVHGWLTQLQLMSQELDIEIAMINEDVLRDNRVTALWAKQVGIPVLQVAHGTGIGRIYAGEINHSDDIAVFSNRSAECYVDMGVPRDHVHVIGNPAWDEFPSLIAQRVRIRADLAKQANLDAKARWICFGTSWNANLSALDSRSFDEQIDVACGALADAIKRGVGPVYLIVKDRISNVPADVRQQSVQRIAKIHGVEEHVRYTLSDARRWIIASDTVLSLDSNMSIEAILAGVVPINLVLDFGAVAGGGFGATDGVIVAEPAELADAFLTALTEDVERTRVLEAGQRVKTYFNQGVDGRATERLIDLVTQKARKFAPPVQQGYVWQEYLDVEEIDATGYHGGARGDLVAMFTNDPKIVLDIGCAAGGTGELLKQKYPNCKVWGIETNKSAASYAEKRLDRVLVGMYEDFDLEKEGIAKGSLDGVILADVLEHMYNPWAVMTSLHAYLSTTAQVIISIPNVRNLKLMEDMAAGFWRYEAAGLLDITHIRFFTLKEFRRFLHETGYHMANFRYGIDQRLAEFFQANRERDIQDIELGRMRLAGVGKEELAELCSLQFYICARMGALNDDIRSYHAEDPYLQYLSRTRLTNAEGVQYDKLLDSWDVRPALAVMLMAPGGGDANLVRTIKNLSVQLYKDFVIWVVSPLPAPTDLNLGDRIKWLTIEGSLVLGYNAVAEHSQAEWVCCLQAGDVIEPHALLRFVEAGRRESAWQMIYCDEDQYIQDEVSTNPVFKPDFDPHALLSMPYLGGLVAIRRQALTELGGVAPESDGAVATDLALKCWERWGDQSIGHLASVLLHAVPREAETVARQLQAAQRVGNAALARLGLNGELVTGWRPSSFRVKWNAAVSGRVSLLIPVRDNAQQVQRCVESLFDKAGHADIELLILDTGSTDSDTLTFLSGLDSLGDPRIRVFRHAEPLSLTTYFNLLAQESTGAYLAFMHFDCVPLDAGWLDALLNELNRPGVGLVAPRLLDGQGKIQGGGLIFGLTGGFAPAFGGMAHDDPGPLGRAHIAQLFSAVSGGFMLIRREHFFALDGFDTEMGAAAEADLCLRLQACGARTLWTPYVSMMVNGAAAAIEWGTGPDNRVVVQMSGDDIGKGPELLQQKWLSLLARDPAYNPGFSSRGLAFEPVQLPALQRPPLPWKPLPRILIEPADLMGCGNYRMIQPSEALNRVGAAEVLFSSELLFPCEYERLGLDSIVLQRQMLDHQVQRLAQTRKFNQVFLVYELDDLITNLPARSLHRSEMPPDVASKLRAAVSLCDRFVVSTEPLAHAYRDLSSDIRVVPNRLDLSRWGDLTVARTRTGKPRVGWAGGVSHSGDLDLIADVVKELADQVDWVFLGMCPERLRPHVKEFYPGVAVDKYPAKLASLGLDLAIAPLEINPFNECKSNLKLLEYGMLGYPVICTDTTPYQGDLPVRRIKNRHKDWVGAIREMVADRSALEEAGLVLQAAVRRDWILEDHLDDWLSAWLP